MSSYLFETHMHTDESSPCGRIPAARITRMYKDAGYDGIVITDHYSEGSLRRRFLPGSARPADHCLKGYRAAREEGEKINLTVLFGLELTFAGTMDDFLVYGLDEDFLYATPELLHLGLPSFSAICAAEGYLVFQAHPFRSVCTVAPTEYINGIEVYNGNPRQDSNNELALHFARRNGLMKIAGSDAHLPEDVAAAGIYLHSLPQTNRELAGLLADPTAYSLSIDGQVYEEQAGGLVSSGGGYEKKVESGFGIFEKGSF